MLQKSINSIKYAQRKKRSLRQFEQQKGQSQQTLFPENFPQNNLSNIKQQLKNLLLCQICRQIMIYPTRLQCGHKFCLQCAQLYLYCKGQCGVCKQSQFILQYSVCNILDDQVKELNLILQQDQKIMYQHRINNYQREERKRSIIGCFSSDMFIDFRDIQENKWRKGKIINVYCRNDIKQDQIVVQPITNNCEQFIFQISSRNITTFGYFTENTIIKRYQIPQQNISEVNKGILQQTISIHIQDNHEKYNIFSKHTKCRFGKISGKKPHNPSSQKNIKKEVYIQHPLKNYLTIRTLKNGFKQ